MRNKSETLSRRWVSDDAGATLIELAVVLPVLLAIGLGTLEFGNLYYKYHLVTNGVRDAARFAAGLTGDVCTDTALWAKIQAIAQRSGADNNVWTTGSTISITCDSFDNTSHYYRGGESIKAVTVTATVPYQSLGFLGYFGLSSPTLTVSHQERVIGVR
ncbi:TadE/TadG family type IV pilus assembly protein [Aestuariivirga sp.]|uniref:TadE/TadG family type IV pilus assembly protein n=1 Tax=Aestuariivirga sp. TaxID=2650926 RepID=UPI00391D3BF9